MTPDNHARGFTLFEVLIGLTLLGVMVVLLFSSLKICADSWEKGETKIAEVNEVGVVHNFFQRHLSAARPLFNTLNPESPSLAFQGKADSLEFVSAFPASVGKSGPQLISLELIEEEGEQLIKVILTPFYPAAEGESWRDEEVTLVRHVTALNFSYFGSEDGISPGVWLDEWVEKQLQPQLVKVVIELENGIYWPEMIVQIKTNSSTLNLDEDTLGQQEEGQ